MIRPVVSLCQMAMNESIATTCCYRWNGVSVTGSSSVLHGGKLSNKANTKYFFPGGGEIPGLWLNKSVKIRPVSAEAANGVSSISEVNGAWYVWRNGVEIQVTEEITGKLIPGNGYFNTGNILGNKNRYTRETTYTVWHIGATTPHYKYTSGNNWLPDHAAVQYSS